MTVDRGSPILERFEATRGGRATAGKFYDANMVSDFLIIRPR